MKTPEDWQEFPLSKSGLPIRWVVDACTPKMGVSMAGRGGWGSPLWILVICIWLCQLFLFCNWCVEKYLLDELMNWKRYWYLNGGSSKAFCHHYHPPVPLSPCFTTENSARAKFRGIFSHFLTPYHGRGSYWRRRVADKDLRSLVK